MDHSEINAPPSLHGLAIAMAAAGAQQPHSQLHAVAVPMHDVGMLGSNEATAPAKL